MTEPNPTTVQQLAAIRADLDAMGRRVDTLGERRNLSSDRISILSDRVAGLEHRVEDLRRDVLSELHAARDEIRADLRAVIDAMVHHVNDPAAHRD